MKKLKQERDCVCCKKNGVKAQAVIQIIIMRIDSWFYFFEIEKLGQH
jgi:hypothetical protein